MEVTTIVVFGKLRHQYEPTKGLAMEHEQGMLGGSAFPFFLFFLFPFLAGAGGGIHF